MTTSNRSMRARQVVVVGAVLLVLGVATVIWGVVDDSSDAVNMGAGVTTGALLAVVVGLWLVNRGRSSG